MGSLDKTTALRLVTLFSGTVKGMALYPASHPAVKQPLMELYKILTTALGREAELSWGVLDGMMFLDDHLFIAPTTALTDLTSQMIEKEVSRIVVGAALSFDELAAFVKLFSVKGARCDDLAAHMAQGGITGLKLFRLGDEGVKPANDEGEDESGDDPDAGLEGGQLKTYNSALSAIRTICLDIERGRIPNSAQLIKVIDQMVGVTMHDPWALLGLTLIKDYDNYTFNHCVNVGVLAMALGAALGLDALAVKDLGLAGQLHDIGKTMISKDILNKPGRLSSAEFEEMKRHPELGSKIIREMAGLAPHINSLVLGHHLHYNRSGYPEWASKLPFDRMIEIIAVADTYDAITTLRVYQHPVSPKTALNEMHKLANTVLDGAIVAQFAAMMGKYPVGTLVRLDSNEVALVQRPNPQDDESPLLRIVIDGAGRRLATPVEQALIAPDGARYARIVAVVDPLLKNIDVGQLIASGHV